MLLDIRRQSPDEVMAEFAWDSRAEFADAFGHPDCVPVIIPTRNGEEDLPATLASLGMSRGPVLPIVVENNSTDRTIEVAEEFGAHVLSVTGSKMGAVQAGLQYAADLGKNVALLTDDDTLFPMGWSERMSYKITSQNDGKGIGVFGTSMVMHGENSLVDVAYTGFRAGRDTLRKLRRQDFSARGHNYGIGFDADGAILETINDLNPLIFEGDAHAILGAIKKAGGAIHTSLSPGTAVVTKGDRFSTIPQAIRGVIGNERSDSYRNQYGADYVAFNS